MTDAASTGSSMLPGEHGALSIHSVATHRRLHITAHTADRLTVELRGGDLSAVADIWLYPDCTDLLRFFQDLGAPSRPWVGERSWLSSDRDFSLSATCTPLGHVTLTVGLKSPAGATEPWQILAALETELGQWASITAQAQQVFQFAIKA